MIVSVILMMRVMKKLTWMTEFEDRFWIGFEVEVKLTSER